MNEIILYTTADGKAQVELFELGESVYLRQGDKMILAVGFRVRSARGVQFRTWANEHFVELRK